MRAWSILGSIGSAIETSHAAELPEGIIDVGEIGYLVLYEGFCAGGQFTRPLVGVVGSPLLGWSCDWGRDDSVNMSDRRAPDGALDIALVGQQAV